jgi:Icc-related predicted phosphoesterase
VNPIRIAATADVHFGHDSASTLRPHLEHLADRADLLVIAGDLTRCGGREEAQILAEELRGLPIAVFAVLGNHDYELGEPQVVSDLMCDAGVHMLDGENATVDIDGVRVGITGVKGFGGGFAGACGSDFGEPEMKAFIQHTKQIAHDLGELLANLDTDLRIASLDADSAPPSTRTQPRGGRE